MNIEERRKHDLERDRKALSANNTASEQRMGRSLSMEAVTALRVDMLVEHLFGPIEFDEDENFSIKLDDVTVERMEFEVAVQQRVSTIYEQSEASLVEQQAEAEKQARMATLAAGIADGLAPQAVPQPPQVP